ncbi:probable glutamate receptor [Penaeus japonicus]|uniref:probable glutamate receptor n=1 Tax=Penaeus japonicus TaxID=27405 RepID=UPI001C710612|nr:probable glutamate receptor [Penaeus japonicus]
MRAGWLGIFLMLCQCAGAIHSEEMPVAHFIADYVRFYRITQVCILEEEDRLPWVTQVFQLLAASGGCYTARAKEGVNVAENRLRNATLSGSRRTCGSQALRVQTFLSRVDQRLFREAFIGAETRERWLLLSNSQFMAHLSPLYLPLNSKVTITNFSTDGKFANIWEAYQVSQHLKQRVTPVGSWRDCSRRRNIPFGERNTDVNGLTSDKKPSSSVPATSFSIPADVEVRRKSMTFGVLEGPVDDPFLRRQDLTGLHLTCTTITFPPLIVPKENGDGSVTIHGILAKYFDTMKEVMNFTYTCYHVKDKQFGAFVDGKWTGMVKEVMEGTADIAVANLAITQQRSTAIQYLTGMISAGFRIVLKRPSNEDYMWTVYTKQFDPGVWGSMVLVVTAAALCLYLVSRRSLQQQNASLSDSAFIVVGFVFGQGSPLSFQNVAERTVVLTVLFLQVVTLAFYTSNLVSALTVGPSLPPYKDLQDIDQEASLTFGFLKGSSNANDFRDSKTPLYQKIWRSTKDEDLVTSYTEGMERVFSERYALMIWEVFYSLNYGQDCRAFVLPVSYFPIYTSFGLAKESPLVPIMNKVVLDIRSAGLMRKWWLELSVDKSDCNALATAPIELKTVLTPFLLLLLSLVVSLSVLAVERTCHWRARRP